MNGPLHYNNNDDEYVRIQNEKVAFKKIYNLQNIINEFNQV
jgi:hypothetical protein